MALRSLAIAWFDPGRRPARVFAPDGTIRYPDDPDHDVDRAIEKARGDFERIVREHGRFAPWRGALFEELARRCAADGTRLVVFVTPWHPAVLAHLRATTPFEELREDVVGFLEERAEERGFTVVDLTELEAFDGDPGDFRDGIHYLDANAGRLLDHLFTDR